MNNNSNIFKEDKVLESLGLSNQVLLFLIFDDAKQFPLNLSFKRKSKPPS